jgi:hypothetical protein
MQKSFYNRNSWWIIPGKHLNRVFDPPGSVNICTDPDPARGVRIRLVGSGSLNHQAKTNSDFCCFGTSEYVTCYLED